MRLENTRKRASDISNNWLVVITQLMTLALLGSLALGLYRSAGAWFGFGPPDSQRIFGAATKPLAVRGQVVSTRAKGVGSLFAGKIASLHVKSGQPVQRGQLLFRMDVTNLRRQLERARADLRSADAEARQAQRRRVALRYRMPGQLAAREQESQEWVPFPPGGADEPAPAPALYSERRPTLRRTVTQSQRKTEQRIAAAATRKQRATREVERLSRLIRQAKRYSPIDGVVTSVRAGEGAWTAASTPIVRVDDPDGCRVVALVRNRSGAVPRPGSVVPIHWSEQSSTARVHKTVPGWDREALYTWVWLRPAEEIPLAPGQVVEVWLPRAVIGKPTIALSAR